jgi:hypothetical protein
MNSRVQERLDINLENEILEISRSFQLLVHAARGG